MGKMLIILVIVITAIFATITLTLQRNSAEVPDTLQRDLDEIQAKNLGAYALNYGIRQYTNSVVSPNPSYTQIFDGQNFPNFNIMNGSINSINYSYIDSDTNYDTLQITAIVSYGTVVDTSATVVSNIISAFNSEVGSWSMDEGNGVTIGDGNENGNDGTLMNTTPGQVWVDGRYGSTAVNLDGTDDRIDLGLGVSGSYGDVMTVACWAKLDWSFLDWGNLVVEQTNVSGWPVVWTLRTRVFSIWFFSLVKYAFDVYTTPGVEEVAIEKNNWQMDIFDWHFIIGTYDGNYSTTQAKITVQVYDEGFSNSKIIPKWSRRDSTNTVSIGGRETTRPWFGAFSCVDGTVEEVKIFDHVLTPAEISNLYIHNGNPTAGILYWRE